MALANRDSRKSLVGHPKPRISPPVPARHDLEDFRAEAETIGITLMPWQEEAAKYLTAKGPDGLLYRDVCIVVARQNGKTTLAKPLIVRALKAGKRVMHIAHTRELPRHMFTLLAGTIPEELLEKRRGRGGRMHTVWPRGGAGQEEIVLNNGGTYRIAAEKTGGARGWTNDLVIIDEIREMTSWDIVHSAGPTLRTSTEPQMVYLSNAGHDGSVVLNALRARKDDDPNLAYLEWSAAPERAADDIDGWAEANPSLGHFPDVQRSLESDYLAARASGEMAGFETESLCRWVITMRQRLVEDEAWAACQTDQLGPVFRPVLGVSLDPDRERASAAMAWQGPDNKTRVRLLFDWSGHPIDTDAFGDELKRVVAQTGIRRVGIDPLTDAELAKYFKKVEPVTGRLFANASSNFVEQVESGKLRWSESEAVTADLMWTARKDHDESGSYQAVRAKDDRPITASLAAIRAVWLASGPRPSRPRIY